MISAAVTLGTNKEIIWDEWVKVLIAIAASLVWALKNIMRVDH